MKLIFSLWLVLFYTSTNIFGQNWDDPKYQFSKKVFENDYKKAYYERFNGNIEIVNEETIKFGEKVLIISTENKLFRKIFEKGIFNPDSVFGEFTTKPLNIEQKDTLSTSQIVFYNMFRNDSLTIFNIEELSDLNPDYKTKRFLLWLFTNGRMNPIEYYFELYNDKAKRSTSFDEFLENAIMTFYYKGTIIL